MEFQWERCENKNNVSSQKIRVTHPEQHWAVPDKSWHSWENHGEIAGCQSEIVFQDPRCEKSTDGRWVHQRQSELKFCQLNVRIFGHDDPRLQTNYTT